MDPNGNYAHIEVDPSVLGISPVSIVGDRLFKQHNKVTVEKTPNGLYWKSMNMYIPPRCIVEVLDGDITEYFL